LEILFITPFLRVPADYGLGIRNYEILKYLSQKHQVSVLTYEECNSSETDLWLETNGIRCTRIPFNKVRSGSTSSLISVLYRFTYPPHFFKAHLSSTLKQSFREICSQQKDLNVILFDTQLTGQLLLSEKNSKPCVLMLADVYEAQKRRKIRRIGFRPYLLVLFIEWLMTAIYEHKIIRQFKHVVAVSPLERDVIQKRHPETDVVLIPNGVDTESFALTRNTATNKNLVFIGTFEYEPNIDAFFYFCDEIFPKIREQHPGICFIAVGRNPPPRMCQRASLEPGIIITGKVDDVRPYYSQATCIVIPLRLGSGTKLKTLEAMAMGVPVVTTTVGCEGIAVQDGKHLFIADTIETFVGRVSLLLNSPAISTQMIKNARKLVEENYDWNGIVRKLELCLLEFSSK